MGKRQMPHPHETEKDRFQWTPQPEAAEFVHRVLDDYLAANSWAVQFGQRLLDETGTRLVDWIDHLAVPQQEGLDQRLEALSFKRTRHGESTFWRHAPGLFPELMVHGATTRGLALRVDSVEDFLAAHHLQQEVTIVGSPAAALRRALISDEGGAQLWVVQRHGFSGWQPPALDKSSEQAIVRHAAAFGSRRREFEDDIAGFENARTLIQAAVSDLGVDRAADLFFKSERDYWQSRNRAAQVQKARQDALGMGWANHDHHTYRASREHFARLIELMELLGCHCRERFFAGDEAGWGAQVLEQTACRVVIFADVDLTPDEVSGDFAHQGLASRDQLGTVGLWCRLHGDAFLQAGMHHLECQFDFERARQQLQELGIQTMAPFTDFTYLKQAFTEGETWSVADARIEAARAAGSITDKQAQRFRVEGVLGSHMEILQRDDGYRGFNQTGISEIIKKTDPRQMPSP